MDLQLLEKNATRAVTVEMAKNNQRVTHAREDDLWTLWVDAAEEVAERYMNRAIMPTRYSYTLSHILPEIQLPRPNFISFVSLKYTETDQSEVVVDTSSLNVRYDRMLATFEIPGIEYPCDGKVEIEYNAGWATEAEVPGNIKVAILLLTGHFYQNRSATYMDPRINDIEKETPLGFRNLLNSYRVPSISDLNGGH